MGVIINFLLGFATSFIGTTPPSMLNMTAAKLSIERSKNEALKFAIGVSLIVLIQVYLAIFFAKYIHNNMDFEWYIKIAGIVIFIVLSFYFFRQALIEKKQNNSDLNLKKGNSFFIGLTLSSLNMFAIPFYCGIGSALNMAGWLKFNITSILFFVLGSAFGTYSLLYVYAISAIKIQSKAQKLTKNLNYFLGFLTLLVATISLINVLW